VCGEFLTCVENQQFAATRATRTGSFAEAERDVIRRALETTKRNKVQTAKLLGISRKKLYTKIKEYGL
jgi:DNA-binding NtrC family response regulator